MENTRYFRAQIRLLGFKTVDSQTPIIPLIVGNADLAVLFSQKLLEQGIFVSAIRPPTVPENTARLRLSIMSTHTKEELDFAIRKLNDVAKELRII